MDYNDFSPAYRAWLSFLYNVKFDVWYTKAMGHRKYGFHFEDVLFENPDIQKALERVPGEVLSDRDDRTKEALVASGSGDILPRERWVKAEDDKPYLAPYLTRVITERRDRELFRPR